MLENLAGNFEGVVQYNRDNTLFEVSIHFELEYVCGSVHHLA